MVSERNAELVAGAGCGLLERSHRDAHTRVRDPVLTVGPRQQQIVADQVQQRHRQVRVADVLVGTLYQFLEVASVQVLLVHRVGPVPGRLDDDEEVLGVVAHAETLRTRWGPEPPNGRPASGTAARFWLRSPKRGRYFQWA